MALDQEAIIAALSARLQDKVPGILTWTRRFTGWDNLPAQPAGVLEKVDARAKSIKGQPTVWTIDLDLSVFYQLIDDPTVPADQQANAWLKAVETALERTPQDTAAAMAMFMDTPDDPRTTLGGLCAACGINGKVDTDSGELGAQGVVIIPIEILATA